MWPQIIQLILYLHLMKNAVCELCIQQKCLFRSRKTLCHKVGLGYFNTFKTIYYLLPGEGECRRVFLLRGGGGIAGCSGGRERDQMLPTEYKGDNKKIDCSSHPTLASLPGYE